MQVSPASGGKIAFGDLTATDILTAGLSDHAVFLVFIKKTSNTEIEEIAKGM